MARMQSLIRRALQQSEDLVLVFDYVDAKGTTTRRVVSPYRLLGETHLLGLCLTREEPRQFQLSRCHNLRVDLAIHYMMPLPLLEPSAA